MAQICMPMLFLFIYSGCFAGDPKNCPTCRKQQESFSESKGYKVAKPDKPKKPKKEKAVKPPKEKKLKKKDIEPVKDTEPVLVNEPIEINEKPKEKRNEKNETINVALCDSIDIEKNSRHKIKRIVRFKRGCRRALGIGVKKNKVKKEKFDDKKTYTCIVKKCKPGYAINKIKPCECLQLQSAAGFGDGDGGDLPGEHQKPFFNPMGLAMMGLGTGLATKKALVMAARDMDSYTDTMHCTYGFMDVWVDAGQKEVELPGGNDIEMMNLRNEYFSLAKDLKERKTALGMKPGIESEEILDKAQSGLYDDESVGITDGVYESWYRAEMLDSQKDKEEIEKQELKNNILVAGSAVAVAAVGGVMVNQALTNKSEEYEQEEILNTQSIDETDEADEIEEDLNFKELLINAGMTDAQSIDLSIFEEDELETVFEEIDDFSNKDFSQLNATQISQITDIDDLYELLLQQPTKQ